MRKIIFTILTIIQIGLMIAVKVVQDLTTKKAGVNHHLRFYKTKYNNQIFTSENVSMMKVALILISILLLILLIIKIYKKKQKLQKYLDIILGVLCCGAIWWMLSSSKAMALLVYPYMVFATYIILILQIIKILLVKNNKY